MFFGSLSRYFNAVSKRCACVVNKDCVIKDVYCFSSFISKGFNVISIVLVYINV